MSARASELPDPGSVLAERGEDRTPAVFLDYDGVLTPIVDNPSDAVMTPEMRRIVSDLARRASVCVVSGRDRGVVTELMGLDDLIVAGSHGFDIWDPRSGVITHDASSGFEELVEKVTAEVSERAAAIEGTLVEPKHASVALHYRGVDPARHGEVAELVDAVLAAHPGELRVTPGKLVHEIQPKIDWNKGRAVEHLLDVLDLRGPGTLPIYLGDDVTDEDAFRAPSIADGGLGVLVIDPADAAGRDTAASAVLPDVERVGRFLDGLAR
ncbi:trehalose-phosphatase [Actinomycetospora sp. TBRC 11914]|uniref:trehalose-phosphatase n=1 Tax=Actinomycetospora sp. TBRC 11914 TaxID=2729387 RepID=UPI00145DAF9E|nr:trehalose-phosphatase [Actinomycetospora sp. TBRC 11914]NMO90549.1 trehalose-phosphatase [Actinomycetospora sp. TBRC 11914]